MTTENRAPRWLWRGMITMMLLGAAFSVFLLGRSYEMNVQTEEARQARERAEAHEAHGKLASDASEKRDDLYCTVADAIREMNKLVAATETLVKTLQDQSVRRDTVVGRLLEGYAPHCLKPDLRDCFKETTP